MKKLQNNFTTPEQSKRLLELGVPADSADCYYEPFDGLIDSDSTRLEIRQNIKELSKNMFKDYQRLLPCWSVGRLIEILLICHIGSAAHIDFDKTIYDISCISNTDWAIRVLECAIECEHIDFSKLEE